MKKLFPLLVLSVLAGPLAAQSFTDFVNYVESLADPTDRQWAVDSFFMENPTAPFIASSTEATFLYQGTAGSVDVAGDHNQWSSLDPLAPLSTTDLWYRTETFPEDARIDYKLIVDGNWILDPLNPFEILGGFGPNSELAMPGYIQPWEINYDANIPHGTIEAFSIMSSNLNATHSVQVYLPPGYADHPDRYYPSLYMHDGHEYVGLASADHILDNLIEAELISELIVVFVRPNNREQEYAFSKRDQYRLFIAEELVDYIDDHYRTLQSPEARGVAGTSFGGNISALIAYQHPDVFGKMGIHSGAFWPNSHEALDLWVDNPVVDVQIASVFGTLETSVYNDMTYFYDAMTDKGYSIYSQFYPEGHSWGLWRATYDEILIELFPPGLTGLEERRAAALAFQVFPNPVIGQALTLELPADKVEHLLLTNSSGQLLATYRNPGQHITLPGNLAPGLYTLEAIGKDARRTATFIRR